MSGDVNPFQSPVEAYPGHTTEFRPGSTRAKLAIAFLALSMFGSLLESVLTYYQIGLLSAATGIDSGQRLQVVAIQGAVSLYVLVAGLGCYIAFVTWFHRAYANLPCLGIKRLGYGTGWAIGAWFVPIGNLIIPYQIMSEVWNGSVPENAAVRYATRAQGLSLVRWWWAAWLLMNFASLFTSFVRGAAFAGHDLDAIIAANWFYVASNTLDLPAGVLAIQLVVRINANQAERHQVLEEIKMRTPATIDTFELPLPVTPDGAVMNSGELSPQRWLEEIE